MRQNKLFRTISLMLGTAALLMLLSCPARPQVQVEKFKITFDVNSACG